MKRIVPRFTPIAGAVIKWGNSEIQVTCGRSRWIPGYRIKILRHGKERLRFEISNIALAMMCKAISKATDEAQRLLQKEAR